MTQERTRSALSGYLMLVVNFGLLAGTIASFVRSASLHGGPGTALYVILAVVLAIATILVMIGFFIVNPNESAVLVLFGTYVGTVNENGFFWANPFLIKKKLSLRARNLNGEKLKVNDKLGNPIQIAAVVVWEIEDTFRASFEVDAYETYMIVQSEAAVRHLAGAYPYDNLDDHDIPSAMPIRVSIPLP